MLIASSLQQHVSVFGLFFWFVCLFFVNKLTGIFLFSILNFFKKATLEPGAKYDGIGPKLTGFLLSPGCHR